MKRTLAILLASVSLAACNTLPPIFSTPDSTKLVLEKAEFSAEGLYQAVGNLYVVVAPSLSPDTKAKAKGTLLSILDCPQGANGPCTGYLAAARQALAASNATDLATQIGAVTSAAHQLQSLLKGN